MDPPGVAGVGEFGPDPTSVVGEDWKVMDVDRRMLELYDEWLPAKVFDAHAHL